MALKCYSTCKYILRSFEISSPSLKILHKTIPIHTHQLHLSKYLSTKSGVKLEEGEQPSSNKQIGQSTQRDDLSLFHRPSKRCIPLKRHETGASVFLKPSDSVIDLSPRTDFKTSPVVPPLEKCLDDVVRPSSQPDARLHSIDELVWQKLRPPYASELPALYARLAKSKLTTFIVLTSMAGYAMAPAAFDPLTFAAVTIGTTMTCAAANAVNQIFEVPFDSQMNRTKNRPIVRGYLTPLHASGFAFVTGVGGVALLLVGVNGAAAALGTINLLLYTCAYTPAKRISVSNTWLGGVVGAIPPMMGWVACTGSLEPGAWLLAGILYAWQFPHFNALSWNLRQDYSRAGYRMMSVVRPALCRRTALTYSLALSAMCAVAPLVDLTTFTFAVDTVPLNAYLVWLSVQFYRRPDASSSRRLFMFTLAHLPAVLLLMLISKKKWLRERDAAPE